MSTLDDFHMIQEQQQYVYQNHGRDSLLAKYKIPIQHFDFDYVSNARDANELEKMVDVLRSGQEGYYPDLLRATEDQLRKLRPNSTFLRHASRVLTKSELGKDEEELIFGDLQKWVNDISKTSKELDDRKTNSYRCPVQIRQCDPQPEPLNLVKNEKRIASTDYKAWDRYDPDAEIMKQTLEEEKIHREAKKAQDATEKLKQEAEKFVFAGTSLQPDPDCSGTTSQIPISTNFATSQTPTTSYQSQIYMGYLDNPHKQKLKKTVTFNEFSTEAEAIFVSNRQLEKGREFFRTGDYELALKCFTESIAGKPNVVNLNNRALTCLKLKKFREALQDCERVLAIEEKNLKALLRKAQALEGLKQYEEALDCVSLVIEKDPNNTMAQELADRVRPFCRNLLKNTRMRIMEIE